MNLPPVRQFDSHDVDQTLALGARLGAALGPNSVVALIGTLGSGKTHLVKGIARGNGTPPETAVNSPTFVIVNEYGGRLPLFHVDAYRLSGPLELEALGFDEMCRSGGAVLIEWADRIAMLLPGDCLHVHIDITGMCARRFALRATGAGSTGVLARMEASG